MYSMNEFQYSVPTLAERTVLDVASNAVHVIWMQLYLQETLHEVLRQPRRGIF